MQTKAVGVIEQEGLGLWENGVLTTLRQRGLLRGEECPVLDLVAVDADRFVYILDPAQLAGVRLEQWACERFIEQLRAATGGRRIAVSSEAGLAVQIGRRPTKRLAPPDPLPSDAVLDLDARPATSLCFGIGREGTVARELAGLTHLMIGGGTGSGKSTLLDVLLAQLLTMPGVLVYIADPEGILGGEAEHYRVPTLAGRAGDAEGFLKMLAKLEGEMGTRAKLYRSSGAFVRDLVEYNALEQGEPLPRLVLLVDEVPTFLGGVDGVRVHERLFELARRGRKYGIHLILAGQDWKATRLDTALRGQLQATVALRCGRETSKIVIGTPAAARLRGKGHALVRWPGSEAQEFQAYRLPEGAMVALCEAHGAGAEVCVLSEFEASLVAYAVRELGGAFSQNPLYKAFGGKISKHALGKLSNRLLEQGVLVKEQRGTDIAARRWVVGKPGNAGDVGQRAG